VNRASLPPGVERSAGLMCPRVRNSALGEAGGAASQGGRLSRLEGMASFTVVAADGATWIGLGVCAALFLVAAAPVLGYLLVLCRPGGIEAQPVAGGTLVRHVVVGEAHGEYEAIWRNRIEPLHDRVLEALLDNVEAASRRS
jgi:hypothetical protein